MRSAFLAVMLAFAGYSILNISQAGQKIGLARRGEHKAKGTLIWLVATAGTSAAFLLMLIAISLGSVSLVGAMAGTGLASLAIFSHFVMRDKLDAREIAAVIVVIGGAALLGAFAADQAPGGAKVGLLWGVLGAGTVAYVVTWIVTRRARHTGAVIGSFSGFLGAYSQLFQEYGTSELSITAGVRVFVASIVTNPVTAVWIGLSVISMIVLQFAFKHGRAIEIIPSFTSTFIAVPVLGGVLIFGDRLLPAQWIGVVLIAAGAVTLGRGAPDSGQTARPAQSTAQVQISVGPTDRDR